MPLDDLSYAILLVPSRKRCRCLTLVGTSLKENPGRRNCTSCQQHSRHHNFTI